jgi:hypothetical protein
LRSTTRFRSPGCRVARISAASRSWCARTSSGRSRRAAASTSSAPDRFNGIDARGADAAPRPGRAHRTSDHRRGGPRRAPRPPDARWVASAGGRRGRSSLWSVRNWVGTADGALQPTVATDDMQASTVTLRSLLQIAQSSSVRPVAVRRCLHVQSGSVQCWTRAQRAKEKRTPARVAARCGRANGDAGRRSNRGTWLGGVLGY